MSCMSSRAMNIACSRAEMSRDSALVMFFYMRFEKHVCNAMSHDLLLALAVVSFDPFIPSTHSSDNLCYVWSESESCRTSFACDIFPIHADLDPACFKPCVVHGHEICLLPARRRRMLLRLK
jgi:hypothetical protein